MKLTRRQFLTTTGTVSATIIAPAGLAPSTSSGLFDRWSEPSDAVTHSGGRLSWIVSTDDALDSLESRYEGDTDTEIPDSSRHEETGTATVIATPAEIGARARDQWTSNGLAFESWVESVELNRTLSLAQPLSPEGEEAWQSPGRIMSTHMSAFGGDLSPSGVAFEGDMESGTMGDVRTVTGATSDSHPDGSGLTIAVIDTGVNDGDVFGDRILADSWTAIDDETGVSAVADGDGHGSWVAACLASSDESDDYRGYLPAADILGVKALADDGSGAIDKIAAAIRYAADQGADLACLSLGSPMYSQAIFDALEYAVEQGMVPVAAAGNDRQVSRWVATPASSEHTIAVGATTIDHPDEALSAYFSNTGPHNGLTDTSGGETTDAGIDVAAPGCAITTRVPQRRGSASLVELTGTSMAAPVTGGNIGLYLADNSGADLAEVREQLEATSEPVPNGAVEEVGNGMPNADNLLAGTEPEDSQEDAMTDEAAARGVGYQQLSQSRTARLMIELGVL